ncbi:MAG: hypothetical protein N2446_02150 [Elusimicrobiales bacterium]|nr:hypothetical protein [Elusimicrobiales bacterium]
MKKRKASLSAVLLLCILIITMSTYVMEWVFDRYTTVIRFHRSTNAKIRVEGVFYNRLSCCRTGAGCVTNPDGKPVNISINCNATDSTPATFSLDDDI